MDFKPATDRSIANVLTSQQELVDDVRASADGEGATDLPRRYDSEPALSIKIVNDACTESFVARVASRTTTRLQFRSSDKLARWLWREHSLITATAAELVTGPDSVGLC